MSPIFWRSYLLRVAWTFGQRKCAYAPLQFYLPPRIEDPAGEPVELVALKTHWRVIEKARGVWQIASSPTIEKNDI